MKTGHSVLFTLLAALAKAESEGTLKDKLNYFAKPKLLVVDELGYLPFEKRSAHLFFQLVARRYEKGSMLLTTNQMVGQWGSVFPRPAAAPQPHAAHPGRELPAAAEEEGRAAEPRRAAGHQQRS